MKEEIVCSVPWYYTITKNNAITVRYIIAMRDKVDGEQLQRAVNTAMTRYPNHTHTKLECFWK